MTALSSARRARILRWTSLGLVVTSALGLAAIANSTTATAEVTDGAITLAWAGGNEAGLQQYQPARPAADDGSGDYDDLKGLTVTVSRTQNLTDGAIEIAYSGMAPTTSGTGAGGVAYSYLTMMQCWGPDPSAADFSETCQWGGFINSDRNIGNDRTFDKYVNGSGIGSAVAQRGSPFRSANGGGYGAADPAGTGLEYFGESTTNEVSIARFSKDGTGAVGFETQSAAAAPHLGCGARDETGTPRRCWLVIVPYGSHEQFADTSHARYGASVAEWGSNGSPADPAYTRWGERLVVPLDFQPTGAACAAGASEVRTTGSALMAKSMGSWQRALCEQGLYSLATNGDDLTRSQLLAGKLPFIYTSKPVDPALAAEAGADIVYAPVAASGLVIAYNYVTPHGKVTTADITPRLVAKLLTQSYPHQIAGMRSSVRASVFVSAEHLTWATGIREETAFWDDPDVIHAFHLNDPENPGSIALNGNTSSNLPLPQIVGPQTADAFAQVWAWLQADDEARAFLQGVPDPGNHNMSVNPYYLPRGSPGAVVSPVYCVNGTPALWNGQACTDGDKVLDQNGAPASKAVGLDVDLASDPVNYFPKADETQAPIAHVTDPAHPGWTLAGNVRFDALSAPTYASGFEQIAQRIIRRDSSQLTVWSVQTQPGQYKAEQPAWPSNTFMIGLLDAPTAAAFSLNVARLQVPNKPGIFVAPDAAGQGATLKAQTPTEVAAVTQTNLAALPSDAYPLTSIIYAATNLNDPSLTPALLASYAGLVRFAAQDGQVVGFQAGQLPPGYAPLTAPLVSQALAAADRIAAGPQKVPATVPPSTSVVTTPAAVTPAQPGITAAPVVLDTELTGGSAGSAALGGSLLLGLLGLLSTPFLLRRKPL